MKEENTTPTTLKEWPGAFGIYKTSRDAMRYNLGTMVQLVLLTIAVSFALSILLQSLFGKDFADSFGQVISFAVSIYFTVAVTYAYLQTVRHKKLDVGGAFSAVTSSLYWRMFLLHLLVTVSVIGGLLLLIVPGIIIALRLSLSPYYLVDKDLSVMDAYKASWNETKGHLGKMWGMIGVGLLMILPVITIVGIVATVYLVFMYSAAAALLYLYLTKKKPAHKNNQA